MNELVMKPKAVVWDVDDVLTPTSIIFYQSVIATEGSCIHPDHWSDYLWGKHISRADGKATQDYLIEHRIIERCEAYDYTDPALAGIKHAGMVNILLSARSWHPDPAAATREWAARNVLEYYIHEALFVNVGESKADQLVRLKETYDLVAFVEDNPIHALAALDIVDKVYMVRRPWNARNELPPHLNLVDTALDASQQIVQSTQVSVVEG